MFVIIYPVNDPGALVLYTDASFKAEVSEAGCFLPEHVSAKALELISSGAYEFTIERWAFVRRTCRGSKAEALLGQARDLLFGLGLSSRTDGLPAQSKALELSEQIRKELGR